MEARRIPGHLLHMYSVLKCAYGEGVPNRDYFALVGLLSERYSADDAAYLLNLVSARTFTEILEHVRNYIPGKFTTPFDVEKLKLKLEPCGYVD
jgi:hypothetical protein